MVKWTNHEEIDRTVGEIRKLAQTDPEAAHALRDSLYAGVLKVIASGEHLCTIESAEFWAKKALKAQKIKLKWEACA
jgi:hypothetical protein